MQRYNDWSSEKCSVGSSKMFILEDVYPLKSHYCILFIANSWTVLMEWCLTLKVNQSSHWVTHLLSCHLMTQIYSPSLGLMKAGGSIQQPPLCFMPQIKSCHGYSLLFVTHTNLSGWGELINRGQVKPRYRGTGCLEGSQLWLCIDLQGIM